MARGYTIELENKSGNENTYVVSAEPPQVEGDFEKNWPLVITRAVAGPNDSIKFTINPPTPYYAYALSAEGRPGHGVGTETQLKEAVQLGKKTEDGNVTPGSTLQFSFADGMPRLNSIEDGRPVVNGFAIRTTTDFSSEDVRNFNVMIGLGNEYAPWSAFAPEPGMTYQLFPQNLFYLYAVNYHKGTILDVQTISNALRLDFTQPSKTLYRAVHGPDGELKLEG